ncbi:MAG TPA: serine protease [Steroidobacteraceae bacterium]|nr:serine protease [Steroidobacteraceae bacterium]
MCLLSTAARAATATAAAPLSTPARDLLARFRPSVVQIRTFYGSNAAEASHGTGFAVMHGGVLLTNYHVVADAILYPQKYRMEYRTPEELTGAIQVLAIDVRDDLALVRATGIDPEPLEIRTDVPARGEHVYSLGYPLDLGYIITEGVANGLDEHTIEPRLYYSGALNPGMSGGPTVDASGAVVGINDSTSREGELLSFLVPARFVPDLLAHARSSLDPQAVTLEVTRQLQAHVKTMLGEIPAQWEVQAISGYRLPAKLAPYFTCYAGGDTDPNLPVHAQRMTCSTRAGLFVQEGLSSGDLFFEHTVLVSERLGPVRFANRLSSYAAGEAGDIEGSARHVTPYSCERETLKLRTLDVAVRICARGYRLYEGLYDFTATAVSLNQPLRGVVTSLNISGAGFDDGMAFIHRYLGALQWTP